MYLQLFFMVMSPFVVGAPCDLPTNINQTDCTCINDNVYGDMCQYTKPPCNKRGTLTYDSLNHTCICKEGFTGVLCDACRDETLDHIYVCYPTGFDLYPYVLISIPSQTLSKFMFSSPSNVRTILPGHADHNTIMYGCDCLQYDSDVSTTAVALGMLVDSFVSARSVYITNTNTNPASDAKSTSNTVLIILGSIAIGMFVLLSILILVFIMLNHKPAKKKRGEKIAHRNRKK